MLRLVVPMAGCAHWVAVSNASFASAAPSSNDEMGKTTSWSAESAARSQAAIAEV